MLYFITNRKLVTEDNYYKVIQKAVEGGVDRIIVREKDLCFEQLLDVAEKIKKITENKDTKLIINGNIEVAKAINAYGVHVSFETFMKEKINFNGIVGVSVHSLEEAMLAEKNGADYIFASHVYHTNCKKGLEPRGVEFICNIASKVSIPVIALGGINEHNIEPVILAGAYGIAVMSYIMQAKQPEKAVKLLKERLKVKGLKK